MNNEHWSDRLQKVITIKAQAAGCEVPEMHYCTIDRTWGEKMGMVFIGKDAERAARFATLWVAKNIKGSYDQQNVAGYSGLSTVTVHSKEGKARQVEGHIVSAIYYPCCD